VTRATFRVALGARRNYLLLSLSVLVLDQISKLLAVRFLAPVNRVELIPGLFNLDFSTNAGGLFGYFSNLGSPWRLLLLTGLPVVAVGMIVWFLARGDQETRPTLLGLSLILGGAVGNLLDRIFRTEVVDFLDVYVAPSSLADWLTSTFGSAHWPTFNVADAAIVTGASLLALTIVRPAGAVNPSDPAPTSPLARPDR
jgi:signal peptidase II